MARAIAAAPVSEVRINRFMAQVYLIMSLGLVVTGVTAAWVSSSMSAILALSLRPGFAFGLFIVQILLVVSLTAAATRMKPAVAFVMFLLYSGLTGVTLSSIFLVYTQENIAQVFWITAGVFFLTSMAGLLLKRDLSTSGNILFMLLLGWTISWFISWFFPYSTFNWALTYIGIALFVGLTAYDTQRLRQMGAQLDKNPAAGGLAVLGALTLYLNFINLFLLILRARDRNR
jgi:FtsH-binding integral membrane protein